MVGHAVDRAITRHHGAGAGLDCLAEGGEVYFMQLADPEMGRRLVMPALAGAISADMLQCHAKGMIGIQSSPW